jgi:4'-phosphopantetheinyl transferase
MICCIHIHDYPLAELKLSTKSELLSADEKIRYARYKKREDRINFLVGRLIVKTNLNGMDPQCVELLPNRYGMPVCRSGNCSEYRHFSISHTDGFVAVLFSVSDKAGIDVEKMKVIEYLTILKEVSTHEELELFTHSENQCETFYKIWTVKEAALKAGGEGFLKDPKTVNVCRIMNSNNFNLLSEKIDDNFFISAIEEQTTGRSEFKIRRFVL